MLDIASSEHEQTVLPLRHWRDVTLFEFVADHFNGIVVKDVDKARGVKAKAENVKVNFSSKCQS